MKKVALKSGLMAILVAGMLASCSKTEKAGENSMSTDSAAMVGSDTAVLVDDGNSAASMWDSLDYNMPDMSLPKVKTPGFTARGNENMATYSLGDNILFKLDEAVLTPEGASDIKAVAENIDERFPGGMLKLYGYADTTGNKDYNKDLSDKRAESVKQYLVGECKIAADRISVQAMGEKNPIPGGSNASDRRVVIVARKKA